MGCVAVWAGGLPVASTICSVVPVSFGFPCVRRDGKHRPGLQVVEAAEPSTPLTGVRSSDLFERRVVAGSSGRSSAGVLDAPLSQQARGVFKKGRLVGFQV